MTPLLWKPSSLPWVLLSQDKNCDKKELLINVSELPVFSLVQGTQTQQAPRAQILGNLKARLWPKFWDPNQVLFLPTSQHMVNNICAEMCMYLVQVDLCPYKNPYSNHLNLYVTDWDISQSYKHGRLWYPGVAKRYLCCASCFNLPRFVCFCFSVHHSSVISRTYRELNWQSQLYWIFSKQ